MLPGSAAFLSGAGVIVACNQVFAAHLGHEQDSFTGQCLSQYLSAQSWSRCETALTAAQNGTPAEIRSRLVMPDSRSLGFKATCTPMSFSEADAPLVLLQFENSVSTAARFEGLLTRFPDDVLVFGGEDTTSVMSRRLEAVAGSPVDPAVLRPLIANCLRGEVQTLYVSANCETSRPDPANVRKASEIRLVPLADQPDQLPGIMAIIRNGVICPKEVEENKRLAYHDPLTGLSNRRALLGLLQDHLERLQEIGMGGLAVFFIDLDEFKKVNDLGGHDAGDDMLIQVATALRSCFSDAGCIGRIGGDEFAGMCLATGEVEVLARANQILDAFSRIRLETGGRIFTIGGSIGIAFLPAGQTGDEAEPSKLLRFADNACLRGKNTGGKTIHLEVVEPEALSFGNEISAPIREPVDVDCDELLLFSMPIHHLEDGRYCGSEILLRLQGASLAPLSMKSLIVRAGRTGFVTQIEGWILDKVLDAAKIREGRKFLSVNVSAETAQNPVFRDMLKARLEGDPLLASRICLELSEREFLRDPETVAEFFRFLAELGCQTAIDDFAGHWPVLIRLGDLKVDWVKLDPGLTRMPAQSQANGLVLKRLSETVRDLGTRVIAKCVETSAEAEALREFSIDAAQGHYFGKPAPWFGM